MTASPNVKRIQTNSVFAFLSNSRKRIKSLRGGTRSGKTYNVLIYFVMKYLKHSGRTLTICRQTMPALRATAMRDFFEILDILGLYNEANHNKTANEYHLNGNLIEFVGLKESRRVRGRKRDDLFINEVNETELEAFRQLLFRTTDEVVIDYNPSEPYHWVYDAVETRDDCDLLVTTYQDNPFLEDVLVEEIERLRDTDQDYWKIYGLGERASGTALVWTHWKPVSNAEYPYDRGEKVYPLDFGYNNPSALLEVTELDTELYWREMLYKTRLTTEDLIDLLKTFDELKTGILIADSAEPKTIEAIRRAGFRIEAAYKDVKQTIDFVKSRKLHIHADSVNLVREIKRYSWKKDRKTEQLLDDEVVKFDDHLMDCGRYGSWKFNRMKLSGMHFQTLDRPSPYASFTV